MNKRRTGKLEMAGKNRLPKVCSVPECDRPAIARSFCNYHWREWRNRRPLKPIPPKLPDETRFWVYVNKDGGIPKYRPDLEPCWFWTRGLDTQGKYGRFGQKRAHVYAWYLTHRKWPTDTIDHLCRVTICVRPDHLEEVSLKENILRGYNPAALNARKESCPQGHPYTFRTDGNGRECRLCKSVYMRERYTRIKEGSWKAA